MAVVKVAEGIGERANGACRRVGVVGRERVDGLVGAGLGATPS